MRWTTRLAELRRRQDDSGAAMVIVLTLMILIIGITVSVTTTLVNQGPAVYQAERGTQTIYAAQSGLQVALGQIRTAAGAPYGNPALLPCTLDGALDPDDEASRYNVTIRYYRAGDPTNQTEAWRTTNKLTCTASGLTQSPYYALLQATGTGASVPGLADDFGDRTVQAVYTFKVTNVNIPGGRINSFAGNHCLSAVTATDGAKIRFRTNAQCTSDGDAKTKWVYDTNYQIKLASTLTTTPLCITGPISGTTTQDAQLKPCLTNAARWNQLWSWTGDYSWKGQKNPISGGNSNFCLAPTNSAISLDGQFLQTRTACDANGKFSPTAEAGAGAASKATNQIVNYKQFGRCMDVTGENINATYQIAYPCKQDPTGTGNELNWNHKWYYNEPPVGATQSPKQQIIVKYQETTNYCLESPAAGVSPAYPTFKICSAGENRQKWIRVGNTGTYGTSYLFIDYANRCAAVAPTDTFNGWSKIVVTACSTALEQKWNAPPQTSDATLGSFKELG